MREAIPSKILSGPKTTEYCIAETLLQAYKGNLKDGFAFTGSNAPKASQVTTVKGMFETIQGEYRKSEVETIKE